MSQVPEQAVMAPIEVTRTILFLWLSSVVATIITFLIIYFKINPNPDTTYALHYTVLVGVDLLGKGTDFYKIPIVGAAITIVNYGMFRTLRSPSNVLSFFLALSSMLVTVTLLVATLFLLRVN